MSKTAQNIPDSQQQCIELLKDALDKARRSELVFRLPRPQGIRTLIPRGHFHSNPEFFFQMSGKVTFTFPQSSLTLNAGEVLMIPSWLCHSERSSCYKTTENMVIMMTLSELSWHRAKTISPCKYATSGYGFAPSPKLGLIINMCNELTHIRHGEHSHDRFAYTAMITSILHLMKETISSTGKLEEGVNHKVASCRQLINSNLANPELNVKYLAERLGCNADYLSHLFQTKAGMGLTEFINNRRIQVAVNLLDAENLNISEVAYACGYSDPGYFSRVFRKITGKAPGEFRRHSAG